MSHPVPIAYDARPALGESRGMGHYIRSLIAGREQQLLGFCATGEYDPQLRLVADGFERELLWNQFSIPRLLRHYRPHIFITACNTVPLVIPGRTALVVLVQDLNWMDETLPPPFPGGKAARLLWRTSVPAALRRAEVIVAGSSDTASQIASRFAINSCRLRVIPFSICEEWYESSHGDAGECVLLVTGDASGKGLLGAMEAFAKMRAMPGQQHLLLKIAGVRPDLHSRLLAEACRLGICEVVEFFSNLTDGEIRQLYRAAAVVALPFPFEGVGVALAEALASGVPAVCGDRSSFREIGADAVAYVDPLSPENMARVLQRIVVDPELRERMKGRGLVRARRYHPAVVRSAIESFWTELAQAAEPFHGTEFVPC